MPTQVTYAMIESAPANIRDYGAIGDGIADDTAAIQAAIAASTNVFFPSGTYKITSSLVIRSGCFWRGEAGTIILKEGVSAAISDTSGVSNDFWTIEMMVIRCASEPSVLDGSTGIAMGRSRRATLRGVAIQFFATGILLNQPDVAIGNYFNHLEDVRIYCATNEPEATAKNVRGIFIFGANANYLENCEIYGFNNRGIDIDAVGCQITAAHIEHSKEAVYINAGASNNNIEVYCEATTGKMGIAEAGSEFNNLWLYRDGSGDNFEDYGYNTVAAITAVVDQFSIQRNGGFQYITGAKGYAASASAQPIFKLVMPEFGQLSMEINAILNIPGVGARLENSNYVASYISSPATLTQINQTNDGLGAVFSTSVSGNEITFSSANSAGASAGLALRYSISINSVGLKSTPGYDWLKNNFVLL